MGEKDKKGLRRYVWILLLEKVKRGAGRGMESTIQKKEESTCSQSISRKLAAAEENNIKIKQRNGHRPK